MSSNRKTKLISREQFPFKIRLTNDSKQHMDMVTIPSGTEFDYVRMNTFLLADNSRVFYYEARRIVKGITEVYNFRSDVVEILDMPV